VHGNQGMKTITCQKCGFKVVRIFLFTKQKNDTINKKFKTQGKELYMVQFVQTDPVNEEFIINWDNTKNTSLSSSQRLKDEPLNCTNGKKVKRRKIQWHIFKFCTLEKERCVRILR
jgi:hypothetical protein